MYWLAASLWKGTFRILPTAKYGQGMFILILIFVSFSMSELDTFAPSQVQLELPWSLLKGVLQVLPYVFYHLYTRVCLCVCVFFFLSDWWGRGMGMHHRHRHGGLAILRDGGGGGCSIVFTPPPPPTPTIVDNHPCLVYWMHCILESLYKESSAMRGLKVWKQNGVQILSIEKTQVLTMHE